MSETRDTGRDRRGRTTNVGPMIDPRLGDVEDDASSTKRRSMLSLAGSLFAEISPAKLILSWALLFALPGLLLGLTPLIVSAWGLLVTRKIASPLLGIWPLALLALLAVVGLMGARSLVRLAESSFWALNSLAVQPVYAGCREVMRHLAGSRSGSRAKVFNAIICLAAGAIMSAGAVGIAVLAWPFSRWIGHVSDLAAPGQLVAIALANSVVLLAGYLAAAAFVWACADAAMQLPSDLETDRNVADVHRTWRIAHLSDIHTVGERYGFRIESGRSGPRGNGRLRGVLAQLDEIHARDPLDVILITGDLTDAGRSSEWSELMDELAKYPQLCECMLILPGNHDLNIVDRANPARLDLPMSPNRTLRRLRFLAAAERVQGSRVRLVDLHSGRLGATLTETLQAHRAEIASFADRARPIISRRLDALWGAVFPMIVPPLDSNGLGVMLLNSNAETHFSFTNALGMMTSAQMRAIELAAAQYPDACWVLALHHHMVEYPKAAKVLSERIGTTLINGSWFIRRLHRLTGRIVAMHGHRHTDWIGECASVPIVSAPSPVMEATDADDTYFHVHTVAIRHDGRLRLLAPERVIVKGEAACALSEFMHGSP